MENKRKISAVELVKDGLILLLTCSALWLLAQTPLADPLRGLLREEGPRAAAGQAQGVNRAEGALPLAMVVNLPGSDRLPEEIGRAHV